MFLHFAAHLRASDVQSPAHAIIHSTTSSSYSFISGLEAVLQRIHLGFFQPSHAATQDESQDVHEPMRNAANAGRAPLLQARRRTTNKYHIAEGNRMITPALSSPAWPFQGLLAARSGLQSH